jgi:hypothetical protein
MSRATNHSNQGTRTPARETAAFSALDEERQASMADEGGVSGALMEVDGKEQDLLATHHPRRALRPWLLAAGLVALGAALVIFVRKYPPL